MPLRILVVSNLFPPVVRGGYEVDCAGVVEHLRGRHDVRVLTSEREASNCPSDPTVRRLLPLLAPVRGDAVKAPLAAMRGARIAAREAAEFRPELVYVWNGSGLPHSALYVLTGLGVPVAYRVCEHWFTRLFGAGDQFMRHLRPGDTGARYLWAKGVRALNRADPHLRLDPDRPSRAAICWVSHALRERSPAPAPVEVVHEEVLPPATADLERFAEAERAPAEAPLLLYASRVERQKGADVVVRALAHLRGRGIGARLLLAGAEDPAFGREVRDLARSLGVDGHVELLGRVEPACLVALASAAHVWLMPSVWEEPAPIGCVEAALARVPMVASRVGGIPEVTVDREHGLLFPPGDDRACAEMIEETLRDQQATAGRVARAHQRAQGLRHGPYLAATDRFLERSLAAFGR